MHVDRVDARQQDEIAGNHQPLDMMGVGICDCLIDGLRQAMHVCFARPIKFRQRPFSGKGIASHIFRTSVPINAAHIFAPTNDLTNEAFGSVDRHFSRLILLFDSTAQF